VGDSLVRIASAAALPFLAALLGSLLSACPPAGDDDDASCDPAASGPASVHVCVWYDPSSEAASEGAYVNYRPLGDADDGVEAATTAGCVDVSLSPGAWELRGRNSGGDCTSDWQAVELQACEQRGVDLYVANGCTDG
jgi:hypothetical protein